MRMIADSAATTPVGAEVAAAMRQVLQTVSGNPSSSAHAFGRSAAQRVEQGRRQIAEEIRSSASLRPCAKPHASARTTSRR